ncbi:hypothetical protein AVEN_106940-1 [Araneus ventricosus]|uniref:Uncharacterized protein n=1 Tax=Araneus ventricosus TaxID=182803 RepID=A0A4Y2GH72_ARAVE|nr:hypothetical protein AVEN_106940-1 [Araneus ventricosus]
MSQTGSSSQRQVLFSERLEGSCGFGPDSPVFTYVCWPGARCHSRTDVARKLPGVLSTSGYCLVIVSALAGPFWFTVVPSLSTPLTYRII